uniref:Uncharacterized protein n=1 Tax=Opuntia streptacantha TaxID=393608 RepID=A0A7C9CWR0_OPUST
MALHHCHLHIRRHPTTAAATKAVAHCTSYYLMIIVTKGKPTSTTTAAATTGGAGVLREREEFTKRQRRGGATATSVGVILIDMLPSTQALEVLLQLLNKVDRPSYYRCLISPLNVGIRH